VRYEHTIDSVWYHPFKIAISLDAMPKHFKKLMTNTGHAEPQLASGQPPIVGAHVVVKL
jgi:hypothetical protein